MLSALMASITMVTVRLTAMTSIAATSDRARCQQAVPVATPADVVAGFREVEAPPAATPAATPVDVVDVVVPLEVSRPCAVPTAPATAPVPPVITS
jgi:hypothetical protein